MHGPNSPHHIDLIELVMINPAHDSLHLVVIHGLHVPSIALAEAEAHAPLSVPVFFEDVFIEAHVVGDFVDQGDLDFTRQLFGIREISLERPAV